jgi:hypothetical protein
VRRATCASPSSVMEVEDKSKPPQCGQFLQKLQTVYLG